MIKYCMTAFTLSICLASASAVVAQNAAPAQATPSAASATSPQKQNLDAYISLIRKDVASQKFDVMDSVMQLNEDQAAKFWPIYRDYQQELTKINDQRIANIKQYAQNYNNLTDDQANQLVQNALDYRKQRLDLLAKYYGQVKQSLGAVTAARFVQVEDQLLLLIDLKIDSMLPIVGSSE
jgi:hypothetical protein